MISKAYGISKASMRWSYNVLELLSTQVLFVRPGLVDSGHATCHLILECLGNVY